MPYNAQNFSTLLDLLRSITTSANFDSLPLPFGGHAHTILPALFYYPRKPDHRRIEIPTPDDDFLELDVIDASNDRPVIALFHGLEGSTDRYYIVKLMQIFSAPKFSVVAVNFRSCGQKMNRKKRFYHSGETGDIATVTTWVQKKFPNSAIGAAGFSLGGNALLKFMGEERKNTPLQAAVAISVPYDLKSGSLKIGRGFNQIYERRFLNSLQKKLEQKRQKYPDLPKFTGSTLYDFDDQITGPIHGFSGAEEYYAQCSSQKFISGISKPVLCIHSREDPLCPIDDVPLQAMKANPHVDYAITENGGHVGFLGSPPGWLWQIISHFMQANLR